MLALIRAVQFSRLALRFRAQTVWVEWRPVTLADAQLAHIMRMMRYVNGNRTRAALLLGIDRRALIRRLKEIDG